MIRSLRMQCVLPVANRLCSENRGLSQTLSESLRVLYDMISTVDGQYMQADDIMHAMVALMLPP